MGRRSGWSAVACALAAALCAGLDGQAASADSPVPPAPTGLAIADRAEPLDVEGPPQFGWLPSSVKGDDVQTAYEIKVSTPDGAVVWDSGKVPSSAESYVPYSGPALTRGAAYDWTARTWDRYGGPSPYAPRAHFDTAINDSDWSGAQWIRRVTTGNDTKVDYSLYRKTLTLGHAASPVTRARVYIAASAGRWELHVDGATIDAQYDYQAPGETYYDVEDITAQARAAQDANGRMAIGVKYANWATTNGEPRPIGPAPTATTLAAGAAAGATSIAVASTTGYVAGENLGVGAAGSSTFEVATIKSIDTSAKVVTFTAPLTRTHDTGAAVVSENGPSGLLAKVVVDHADGGEDVAVTDPSWLVTKDTSETTDKVTLRSATTGGSYVEYLDARQALTGWDELGYTPSAAWVPATSLGKAPLPNPSSCANYLSHSSPCGLTHLVPMQSSLSYRPIRPVSVETLTDGTVVADFGASTYGVPVLHLGHGVSGNTVDLDGSYRLDHSTLSAATDAGATTISVPSANFVVQVGDTVTVDAPADAYGPGHPEARKVTAISGTTTLSLTLDSALDRAHTAGAWVEGSRVGTQKLDNQETDLNFYYTERDGAQDTDFFVGMGFRYLQISNTGEPIHPSQIQLIASAEDAPVGDSVYSVGAHGAAAGHEATFTSANPALNKVFQLFQRSALYAGEEEFNDSPDRQDGQFLGDSVNESAATVPALDERALTREAIQNFTFSQQRYWLAPQLSDTAPGSLWGTLQALYPNGDGQRDIPDYTEMYPEWVMRYYQQTGDAETVAKAYQTMKNVGTFVTNNIAASGPNAGLVVDLPGGGNNSGPPNYTEQPNASYQHGILDWPLDMRYDLKSLSTVNGAAEEIVNARAVEVYRALAQAAEVVGDASGAATYDKRMNDLIAAMNARFVDSNGLYDDGALPTGPTTGNTTQHGQAFALAYGIAPSSSYERLGAFVGSQGMKMGPLDLGQLEQSLIVSDQPAALVSLLTDPSHDGPAQILAEGGTSMWEQWEPGCTVADCAPADVNQDSKESFSHGWGSVGIDGMLQGLLGISVTSPGAATVNIAPPREGLDSASGSQWTERGRVTVDWSHHGKDLYVLDVTVPTNVTATVSIPDPDGRQYIGGGAGAPHFVGVRDGRAIFTVGSGRSHFSPGRGPVEKSSF